RDRPILAVSVACGGLEFVIRIAVADASPAESLSADLPAANPHERFIRIRGVRILRVVDEEMTAVLVARIAKPLDRLFLKKGLGVAESGETDSVGPYMLGEIARGNAWRSGLKHEHLGAFLAQYLGDPAATSPRTNHNGVVRLDLLTHRYPA